MREGETTVGTTAAEVGAAAPTVARAAKAITDFILTLNSKLQCDLDLGRCRCSDQMSNISSSGMGAYICRFRGLQDSPDAACTAAMFDMDKDKDMDMDMDFRRAARFHRDMVEIVLFVHALVS